VLTAKLLTVVNKSACSKFVPFVPHCSMCMEQGFCSLSP